MIAFSTTKVKHVAVAPAAYQCLWLRKLMENCDIWSKESIYYQNLIGNSTFVLKHCNTEEKHDGLFMKQLTMQNNIMMRR